MSDTPEVVIKERPRTPKQEETLEQRIRDAAAKFYSELSQDVERVVIDELTSQYDTILHNVLGFERDYFTSGLRLKDGQTDRRLREMAEQRAQEVLDVIDFGSIELTPAQVRVIQSEYRIRLKNEVAHAARDLAQEHARSVAAKVLGIEVDNER